MSDTQEHHRELPMQDKAECGYLPKSEQQETGDHPAATAPTAEFLDPEQGVLASDTLDRKAQPESLVPDAAGRIVLDDDNFYEHLGFNFSKRKKWSILTVIFMVQVSMNFNASIYGNAVAGLQRDFGITAELARAGQGAFLLSYAFGCELWAPFSEEFGRWPVLQLSLFLVNIWQIPCALAPNFATVVGFRSLGGLSCAGGSVTLGMVADLFEADNQQYAVLYVVLSSVGGSVIGPIVGGFLEYHLAWQWIFWLQLILGATVQVMHLKFVPETRATVMLDKKARDMRKQNPQKYGQYYGPNEVKEKRLSCRELLKVWYRPFHFFFSEPIVLFLSLLSGFSDALIFTFLGSFSLVYGQWGFNSWQLGLAFVPIAIGYLLAYVSFVPDIQAQMKILRSNSSRNFAPERRLFGLLFEAPLETIGLFGFAFASYGPRIMQAANSWIAPMIFSTLVGVANFAIYYTTIDYMIASYGPYSASATGGNGFARDFLAGVSAFYATPLYMNIGPPHNLIYASMTLAFIALVVTIPIYIFYWKGQWFRERSKFAQSLRQARDLRDGRQTSQLAGY